MKTAKIFLTASLLMAGTLVGLANQTETLHVGYNYLTCQIAGGVDISNPALLSGIPSTWSDPNGIVNAVIYIWNYSSQTFTEYQYFRDVDAFNNFFGSSGDGWYDAGGSIHHVTWNPGEGVVIELFQAIQSGNITLVGANAGSTLYPMPLTGFDLRGSPTPTPINGTYVVPADIIAGVPQNGDAIYVYKDPPGTCNSLIPGSYLSSCFTFYYYDSNQGGWVPATPHITPNYRAVWVTKLSASAVIEGNVYIGGNCSSTTPLPNWTVQAVSGPNTYFGVTGANGHFAIIVPPGTYTLSSFNPPNGWTELCAPNPTSTFTVAPGQFYYPPGDKFYEKPTVSGKDLAVDLVTFFPYPLRSPCCGQNLTYVISYRNAGTAGIPFHPWDPPAQVVLTYPGNQIPGPESLLHSAVGFGTRTWTLPPLPAYASGNIKFTVQLPSSPCSGSFVPTPTAIISFSPGVDVKPLDNTQSLPQQITCSYDPNDLEVSPAGCGPQGYIPSGQPLTYLIRFQNIGNGPAYQVVVSNKLDANLDVSTLQVIGSSHANVLQVQGQQLVWTFPNIYLAAQADDDLGSQGYIKYQVTPLAGNPVGTMITNRASVVFDLNAAINTVTTTNTISASPLPVATFSVASQPGTAGHTSDFTYTGGSAGATYSWSFGPDATPSASTSQNPTGVVFGAGGEEAVSLQVSLGGCQSDPATQLIYVGQPVLNAQMTDDGQFGLSWEGLSYHLQERSDLKPGTLWVSSGVVPTQVGSSYAITLPVTASAKFYRLSQVAP